ncbi:hypothetical protein N0V82_002732 [Gnomoniopsis sp. IMI 355080]|nr:hypothetical protein N0V82_002732 [Gnomoniopsis sp. IMI 355080]
MPETWPTNGQPTPINIVQLDMDLDMLNSAFLLHTSSGAVEKPAEYRCDDYAALPTKSEELEDLSMLDLPPGFGQNEQGHYESSLGTVKTAHAYWCGQFHGPSFTHDFLNKVESLALQQRIRSNAPSPPTSPNTPGVVASQAKGFQAESDDAMDMEECVEAQAFFTGMVKISKVDLDCCDDPFTDSYPFGADGVFPFNLLHCSPVRNYTSPIVDKAPSSIQVHMADISRTQQTRPQDIMQQEPMAHMQQRVVNLQTLARNSASSALELSATSASLLQNRPFPVVNPTLVAARIDERMGRALMDARAAEDVLRLRVPFAASQDEAHTMEQQAEDAQRLVQELVTLNHDLLQQLMQQTGAIVTWPAPVSQSMLTMQHAAPAQPQMIRQDQISVQPMAQAQPMSLAGPINQIQQALAQTHQSLRQMHQALEEADQSVWAQQQAWANFAPQPQGLWHQGPRQPQAQAQQHLQKTQQQVYLEQQAYAQQQTCPQQQTYPQQQAYPRQQIHPQQRAYSQQQAHPQQQAAQQQARPARHAPQPVGHPQQPHHQATPGPTQRAAVFGQLLPVKLGHEDHSHSSTSFPTIKQEAESHQDNDSFLRGGSSRWNRALKYPRDEVNGDGSQDVQRSPNPAESDKMAGFLTLEEKQQVAQNDLDRWRNSQRRRLHASLPPSAQPSSSSVAHRQINARNEQMSSNDMGLVAGTLLQKPVRTEWPRGRSNGLAPRRAKPKSSTPQEEHMQSLQRSHPNTTPPPPSSSSSSVLSARLKRRREQLGQIQREESSPPDSQATPPSPFAELIDEATREVLAPGPGRCGISEHGNVLAMGEVDYQKMDEEAALGRVTVEEIHLDDDETAEESDELTAANAKGRGEKQQDAGAR